MAGALVFTRGDENVHCEPCLVGRGRLDFGMGAVTKAGAETGEDKGHYHNVTAFITKAQRSRQRMKGWELMFSSSLVKSSPPANASYTSRP